MAKLPNQSWREYLVGYGQLRWRSPDHERRYHEILGLLQPLYELRWGNLLNRAGPKVVIATRTPKVVQEQGHPPFTFKLQCGVTGRMSQAIPYERLIEFGILTADTKDGGPFPKQKLEIEDRIAPLVSRLDGDRSKVAPYWDGPGLPWDLRYSEYLQSEQWLELREQVLKRDKYRCQWTGKSSRPGDPLQVHHMTYDRVGCERMEDLITVCRSAHQAHHNRRAA